MRLGRSSWLVLLSAALVGGCSESSSSVSATSPPPPAEPSTTESAAEPEVAGRVEFADDGSLVHDFGGTEMAFGVVPPQAVAADPDLEPIRIGMINLDDSPVVAFDEISATAHLTVDFVNAELGGLGGRPLQLESCNSGLDPIQAESCARDLLADDVVAVIGGPSLSGEPAVRIFEANGVPYLAAGPSSLAEFTSDHSFAMNGGYPGSIATLAEAIVADGHEVVSVVYPDFGFVSDSAETYGVELLRRRGVDVRAVEFAILTTDYLPVISEAAQDEPDAILLGLADLTCAPALVTAEELAIEAELYTTSSCAAPEFADAIGTALDGVQMNAISNRHLDPDDVEIALIDALIARDAPQYEPGSLAELGVMAVMNLYTVLGELDPNEVSSETVLDRFRAPTERRSFGNQELLCDRNRVPDLPAVCATSQYIVVRQGSDLIWEGDFYDLEEILSVAG